ncbi:unnamed protein product [Pylaiella littoralis]
MAKASLAGILQWDVAPEVASRLGAGSIATTRSNRGSKAEGTVRSRIANILTPFAYSYIGTAKVSESGGQAPSPATNPFVAVAKHVWPGADTSPEWQGMIFLPATLRTSTLIKSRIC